MDVSDVMKYDVFEILNDIHVGFNHPKGQYRKALLQLKQFDEEEKNKFLFKYAEWKIDVIEGDYAR